MSENDSESSQHFTSHSTNLGLMGSVGPRLLPCSWDLLCSALLCLLSSHSQNIGYPAYSAVILFFISASSFFIFTFPTFLSPASPALSFSTILAFHSLYWVAPIILCILCKVKQFTVQCTVSYAVWHSVWVSTIEWKKSDRSMCSTFYQQCHNANASHFKRCIKLYCNSFIMLVWLLNLYSICRNMWVLYLTILPKLILFGNLS